MSNEFKPGDIVQLKSGGPKMTVNSYASKLLNHEAAIVHCQWFAGAKMEMGSFPEASLQTPTDK